MAENGKGSTYSGKLETRYYSEAVRADYEQSGQYPEQDSPGIQEIADEGKKDATDTSQHSPGSKDNDNAF